MNTPPNVPTLLPSHTEPFNIIICTEPFDEGADGEPLYDGEDWEPWYDYDWPFLEDHEEGLHVAGLESEVVRERAK